MNFNELSLSVLARKKGCGPGFHKGTAALHSLLRPPSIKCCLVICQRAVTAETCGSYNLAVFSGFQGLELVPGLFVHTGLGTRPQEVHPEQRQLEGGSRQPTDRRLVLTTELAPQLCGGEKHPLESYPFLLVHSKSHVFKLSSCKRSGHVIQRVLDFWTFFTPEQRGGQGS